MKHRLYKVYWIRTLDMLDPYKEGYIGITKNQLDKRLGQHKCSKRPIGYQVRQQDVIIEELHRGMKEDALKLEYQYRPLQHIGWNIMAGGNVTTVVCSKCLTELPKGHKNENKLCATCNKYKGTFEEGNIPHNYGKGEKYKLTNPDGIEYMPDVFTVFCREQGLNPQNLRKVAKGNRKHHKGWTAVKL